MDSMGKLMEINYFDIREKPTDLKGKVSVLDIFEETRRRFSDKIPENDLIRFDLSINDISSTPQHNPQKWEQAVGTLIFAISGQLPTRDDVKRARQVYEALPRRIRINLTPETVFGTFPYLITACKLNLDGANQNGTNSLENMVSFSSKLFSGDPVIMRSFFCAHKERRAIAPDMLCTHVKRDSCHRAIYLVNGMIKNSTAGTGKVYWHHAKGTPYGMNTVFPNIFLNYVEQGALPQLGATLDLHYQEMGQLTKRFGAEGITFLLEDVEFLFKYTEQLCESTYGNAWRTLDINNIEDQEVKELALSAASIFTRFLSANQIQGILSENAKKYLASIEYSHVEETMRLFTQSSSMSIIGRSLLDVMFYRGWGELSAKEGSIAFGLDRDHELHQVSAFSRGYSGAIGISAPIVYARETIDEKTREMEGLNRLAIRQFWR